MASPTKTLLDLFDTPESQSAQRALDFLDGNQEPWMVKLLNDPQKGRRNWLQRGIIPRHRNITRAIVEKSGLLFAQNPPRLALYPGNTDRPDDAASEKLVNLFEEFDWIEFFNNFDTVVRLLKTALILVQWDAVNGKLVPSILTQANSFVQCDPFSGELKVVIVKLSTEKSEAHFDPASGAVLPSSEESYFRIFTKESITDFVVDDKGNQLQTAALDNPFGVIPVAVFHDTVVPRADCFWNQGPHDLLAIQEMYNLHLTDSEYAASYAKLQTLVTNARIIQDADPTLTTTAELYGTSLPRQTAAGPGVIAGPGTVITLEANGATPFVQFMGPEPDLDSLDQMFQQWISNYAADWSVNVKAGRGDHTNATSGFQLVVEEIDNIQLRQRRQKMMSGGFGRLFKIVRIVMNTLSPGFFGEDLDLALQFAHPRLPIDQQEEETVWDLRIAGGRASVIDYFIEVKGMTHSEAVSKALEVQAMNAGQFDFDPAAVIDAERDQEEGELTPDNETDTQTQ